MIKQIFENSFKTVGYVTLCCASFIKLNTIWTHYHFSQSVSQSINQSIS